MLTADGNPHSEAPGETSTIPRLAGRVYPDARQAFKTALAEIVKGEDPSHPWSDEELVKQLAFQGIKLARPTVAKYREELNILPSHLRRQF